MWIPLAVISAIIVVAVSKALSFFSFIFQRKYIPNIPVAKDEQHWFWGLGRLIMPIDGLLDSHFQLDRLVAKYGPIFQYDILWNHILHITDGKLAKTVLEKVAQGKGSIQRREKEARIKNIFLLNTNDDWKRRRVHFRQAFTLPSLRGYNAIMHGQVQRLIDFLRKAAIDNEPKGIQIDALYSRFALDAIFQLGFELNESFLEDADHFEDVNTAIQDFFQLTWLINIPFFRYFIRWAWAKNLCPFLPRPIGRFYDAFGKLRALRRRVLAHLRQKYKDQSFQSACFGKLLMEFVDSEMAAGTGITEDDVESELMIFILAGHETTAHSLSFATYALASHPDVFARCQQEIQQHLSSAPDAEHPYSVLTPLPEYVEACIKESMRKYPVAARGSLRVQLFSSAPASGSASSKNEPTVLDISHLQLPCSSVTVPEKTIFHINIFSLHNSKRIWGEDAAEYRPERWLKVPALTSTGAYAGASVRGDLAGDSPDVGAAEEQLVFLPFSFGPRNCIGMNFALWELRSVLCAIINEVETISLPTDQYPVLADESQLLQTDMITMKPALQLPVRIKMRSSRG
jgi:cytochrome P450